MTEEEARATLKPGDEILVPRCPGENKWFQFSRWDGHWIMGWPMWDKRLREVDDISYRQILEIRPS